MNINSWSNNGKKDKIKEYNRKREYIERYSILKEKQEMLEERLLGVHGIRYGEVINSGTNKTIIEKVYEIDLVKEQIKKIETCIYSINDFKIRTIMIYKFIDIMSTREISFKVNYSKRQIDRIRFDTILDIELNI